MTLFVTPYWSSGFDDVLFGSPSGFGAFTVLHSALGVLSGVAGCPEGDALSVELAARFWALSAVDVGGSD